MKASDLKPGQFFEFDIDKRKTRCRRTATGYEYIVEIPEEDFTDAPVTPLAVTGWDDEPQSEPAPLQLREGGEYVMRDGRNVGPLKPYKSLTYDETRWTWDFFYWDSEGRNCGPSASSSFDLIAEVPPPVEPVQFKAGDWVVCVDANGCSGIHKGDMLLVSDIDEDGDPGFDLPRGKSFYLRSRFRLATPAEVAGFVNSMGGWQHRLPEIAKRKPAPIDWVEVVTR